MLRLRLSESARNVIGGCLKSMDESIFLADEPIKSMRFQIYIYIYNYTLIEEESVMSTTTNNCRKCD